jgi:DNA-binding XRE family transcriptional regulator
MVIARKVPDWANLISDRRRSLAMTQAELARLAGTSRQTVIRFENGKATDAASLRLVLALCDAVDLDPYLQAVDDLG